MQHLFIIGEKDMKKTVLTALALGILVSGALSNAQAAQVTLIEQGSTWSYKTLDTDLWTTTGGWSANANYDYVNWTEASSWASGPAAFGNQDGTGAYTGVPYSTYWQAGTDLALLQNFTVTGSVNNIAGKINVAVDNGFIAFLNGQEIARETGEGWTSYWEYTLDFDSGLLQPGVNEFAILAADHGVATAFDMQLTADVNPVPVPATVVLLATALTGLAGTRLRRKNK